MQQTKTDNFELKQSSFPSAWIDIKPFYLSLNVPRCEHKLDYSAESRVPNCKKLRQNISR